MQQTSSQGDETPRTPSTSQDHTEKPVATKDDIEYPPTRKLLLIMLAMFSSAFLVALDRTIIGTAIPKITDDFDSLGDVGWYASSYLLTMCSFQPLIGRIYTFFDLKKCFIVNVILFEIGSVVCGAAPTSTAFIIGRAVAGIGAAGIFSGAIPIFVYVLPLERRPAWTGMFGMVFGIASVVAPLLGGAFTEKVSWRWCFYINLPIGAVVLVIIVLVLHLPFQNKQDLTWKQKLDKLDPIGTFIFVPSIICLLLALQWGGVTYSWSDARIIVLFVLFAASFVAFIGVQIWRKDSATIPPRLVKNRNIIGAIISSFCIYSALMVFIYYIPIWFQAIKGASPLRSGIMNLPLILGLTVTSIIAGVLTKKIGYYLPWLYAAVILIPIGAGLMCTWTRTTGEGKWIGYQLLFGLGLGLGMQQPNVAIQTVLARNDVPMGVSLAFFSQNLGGAIFTSISNNVFTNKLARGLAAVPGVDLGKVTEVGATNLRTFVAPEALPAVLDVYNSALVQTFYIATGLSACTILGVLFLQMKSIKERPDASKHGADVEAATRRGPSARST